MALLMKRIDHRDGILSWLTLLASVFITACSCGFLNIFGICYNYFLERFDNSKEKTAWTGSLPTSLMFVLGPVSCWIINKAGLRLCTMIAAFLVSLSLLMTSFATNLDLVFISFSVPFGLGSSVLLMASVKSVCIYFDKWLSLAYGLQTGCVALLQAGFSSLLVLLLKEVRFERTFQILSAVFLVICLAGGLTFCPTSYAVEKDEPEKKTTNFRIYFKLLKNKKICIFLVANFIVSFAYGVSSIHQVQLAIEKGVQVSTAKLFPVFSSISCGLGRICCGLLLDLKVQKKIAFYQLVMFLTGLTCFLGLFATTEGHLIAYIWIYSALDGMVQTCCTPCLRTITGLTFLGEAYSMVLTVDAVSLLLGPPLVGLVVEKTRSYNAFFYMSGTPYIAAFIELFLLRCVVPLSQVETSSDKRENENEEQLS
ncbi:monocarboxylate transporter 10-like isoform X3 [Rhopilema esculentum]|uniref:monocarboxylate transporter 10-like isoform X3 n=1 Tax=Rhopilema esculentum TaxID=499914 RepID=UPI0031E19068